MTTALALESFSEREKKLLPEIDDALTCVIDDRSNLHNISNFLQPLPFLSDDDWYDIERQAKWVILLSLLSKQSRRFRQYVLRELLHDVAPEIRWWYRCMDFLVVMHGDILHHYFQIFITRFFHKDEYQSARAVVLENDFSHIPFSYIAKQLAELSSYRRACLPLVLEFEQSVPAQ